MQAGWEGVILFLNHRIPPVPWLAIQGDNIWLLLGLIRFGSIVMIVVRFFSLLAGSRKGTPCEDSLWLLPFFTLVRLIRKRL